jgi:hypothetical protein
MNDDLENINETYEDQQEVDAHANFLYEMIATIRDELKEGSTLYERYDHFKYYFERVFDRSIDDIENIEELISGNATYIDIYTIIKDEMIKMFDNYFGITFDNTDKVYLEDIYAIYRVIYLGYVMFLCNYAFGKGIEKGLDGKQLLEKAITLNKEKAIDIADTLIGQYILNEDEFTSDNIAKALELSDPGNTDYIYLFGEAEIEENDTRLELPNVIINNEAFRLRIKYEYSSQAMKYLFEIIFDKFANNNTQGVGNG